MSRRSGTGAAALEALDDSSFDCCVVDLRLPDMSGFELLERMQADGTLRDLPVVVFTGKELSTDEESRLKRVAKSVVLKDVQSPERLFDETALFLHRVVADLPARQASSCSNGSTARTTCSAAARCSSWTTTRATSSRWRRCSRTRTWKSSARRTAARRSR